MPKIQKCQNGDLKKTHTLVYHNAESSPTKSNDIFVTPRSDFDDDPIDDPDHLKTYHILINEEDFTKNNGTNNEPKTNIGTSAASTPTVGSKESYQGPLLLNTKISPVNNILLMNDDQSMEPCPQTTPSKPVVTYSEPVAEIFAETCFSDEPLSTQQTVTETKRYSTDIILEDADGLSCDTSATELVQIPTTNTPTQQTQPTSYSKFFMNCANLFTNRIKPDTLTISKESQQDQKISFDGGVLDTFASDCRVSTFSSSNNSKQDYDRSNQSRVSAPRSNSPIINEIIKIQDTELADEELHNGETQNFNLDKAAELIREVKITECTQKPERFVKKHRRIISVVSQTSLTKKRDSTLGFKNYLKGLIPFGDYNNENAEHTLDMHHFSYNAPCKNIFMRYCPATLHVQFAAMRSMNNDRLFYRKSPLSMKSNMTPQGRPILRDISFQARSGELGVILGGSGSGKTTLLDAFAKRLDSRGYQSGKILLDGLRCTRNTVKNKLAYVIQHDRLLPNLTVKETLTFVAKLYYPTFTAKLVDEKVSDVLDELGLMHIKSNRVGDDLTRGVSGGERRRLSIACQLIKFTNILLLDEPTTGLDSFNAYNLIETLARLSRKNIVVVASIHQPRSELFPFFDVITLMSQGNIVYHGKQRNLIPYFTSLGYPCPSYQNPLDHYIDVVSVDRYTRCNQLATETKLKSLIQHYRRSPHYMTLMSDLGTRAYADVYWNECQTPCVALYKMGLLVHRMNINVVRSIRALGMRSTVGLMFALMLFAFILRLSDDQAGMQNRIGLLFQIVNGPTYFGIMNAIDLYPALRDLFYRESLDGLYQPWQFILAYFLHILPFTVVTTFMFGGLCYWGIGFFPAYDRFLYFTFTFLVLMFNGEVITLLILGAIQDPVLANGAVSLIMSLSITVGSGFIRNFQTLHPIFEILSYGSMHRYASACLASNEFSGLNLTCSEGEYCQYTKGDDYLNLTFPKAMGNEKTDFAILCSYVMALALLAVFVYSVIRIPRLR